MIPSVAGAIHLLHYPLPPIKQNAPISLPMKHPWYIQEAPERMDVQLWDNAELLRNGELRKIKLFYHCSEVNL